jgi:hypothetical protein
LLTAWRSLGASRLPGDALIAVWVPLETWQVVEFVESPDRVE